MGANIYINAFQCDQTNYMVDIETLIIINIYKIAGHDNINLKIKLSDEHPTGPFIKVDMSRVVFEVIETAPEVASHCLWPAIVQDKYIIAGLCSVARQIVKCSDHKKVRRLLGFRDACLLSCSETSIWTKFCEVDMISTIRNLLKEPSNYCDADVLTLPPELARFEYHMAQPVRMFNIYKVAREQNKEVEINSSVPIKELNLHHTFSEGLYMTLSDVVLYPCFQIFFQLYPEEKLKEKLPLTVAWFKDVIQMNVSKLKITPPILFNEINTVIEPDFVRQSLYTADPARYKPEKRIYTKQKDITNSLRIINNKNIEMRNDLYPYGDDISFNWSRIPMEANPMGGALPEKRANRKCDQLANLARSVIKLAAQKTCRIVDFCSGSGHLGILLAFVLPKCTIILIENKEMSLVRAKERIAIMNLTNIVILQSNLDYFIGSFDIGVSLHACGVATDLVIQSCIKNKAHFVCCPCCYGGIHDCYHLTYPRSEEFQALNMNLKDYLTLAHAADQTHDPNNRKTTQGFICMDAIDTDRKLYAESCGYEVHLGKLQPFSCTNKNNLLVGIFNNGC